MKEDYTPEERTGDIIADQADGWIGKNWKWMGTALVLICSNYFITQARSEGVVDDVKDIKARVTIVETKIAAQDVLSNKIDNLTNQINQFQNELIEYRKERMDDLRRGARK